MTDDLRAALEAALPDMAPDQAQAARTLVAALTPPMEEPTWPPVLEAERAVDAMRRTAGIRAGVRALDALLDLGWRPGGER